MDRLEPGPDADPAAGSPPAATHPDTAEDTDRRPAAARIGLGVVFPNVEMLDVHRRIAILRFIQPVGRHPRHFGHHRHRCPIGQCRRIRKQGVQRQEAPLGFGPLASRPLIVIKWELKDLNLGPFLEAFALEHLTSHHEGPATIRIGTRDDLIKGQILIDLQFQ